MKMERVQTGFAPLDPDGQMDLFAARMNHVILRVCVCVDLALQFHHTSLAQHVQIRMRPASRESAIRWVYVAELFLKANHQCFSRLPQPCR